MAVNKTLKSSVRAVTKNRRVRNALAKSFGKANSFWKALESEEFLKIYDRYSDYTRLSVEAFCANLAVVNTHGVGSGAVVECGVWRGGMSAGMADILGSERRYYLLDSFEGLPSAEAIDGIKATDWQKSNAVDNCKTEESFANDVMSKSSATDFNVLKGWFSDTLEDVKGPISVLRLDADWYSSTAECLNILYDKVEVGGLIILDDYFAWDGCARAAHDFLAHNALADRIQTVDTMLAFMIKKEAIETKPIDPKRSI
ncbi:TylF/MycF/NovP-related O-methyltransferase [Roseovarius phycicola]|uniref:TylF/MycF/NovP-related O-methyltransferase n=1 Tax=Roseovarius phycicola TaxID=3080976 RepID=A0ABZ2HDD4_9RHOB